MSTHTLPSTGTGGRPPVPLGRWRSRSAWAGPYGSEPGPRPPLARTAAVLYGTIAVVLLGLGLVGLVVAWGNGGARGIAPLLPIVLYSGWLAYGAERIQSRSVEQAAPAWVCAPVLLHAACGLLGASTMLWGSSPQARHYGNLAQDAAMFGMFFGWIPALVPFCFARRAGALLLAAFSGPIALLLVIALS